MTTGPDQSPLISIGVLELTLIGCKSSPSWSRTYGFPEQPISIHISHLYLFIYLFHTLFTVCDGRKTVYILDTRKTKKIQHMCCHYYETEAYWVQCISFFSILQESNKHHWQLSHLSLAQVKKEMKTFQVAFENLIYRWGILGTNLISLQHHKFLWWQSHVSLVPNTKVNKTFK